MRVYVAGRMTGLSDMEMARAFNDQTIRLRQAGHEVVSPLEATIARYGTLALARRAPWSDHLLYDLDIIRGVDAVCVLRNWLQSDGARTEVAWAVKLGKPVYDDEMVELQVDVRFHVSERFPTATDAAVRLALDGTEGGDVLPGDSEPSFSHGDPCPLCTSTSPHSHNPLRFGCTYQFGEHAVCGVNLTVHDPARYGHKYQAPASVVDWSDERKDAPTAGVVGARVADASGAVKADGGKTRLDLLPRAALVGTADVLAFGATKYPDADPARRDYNWRRGFLWSRIYGAALRHLTAWWDGEDLDPETGLSHLDHASCDVMFLQEFVKKGTGTDDRYKGARP